MQRSKGLSLLFLLSALFLNACGSTPAANPSQSVTTAQAVSGEYNIGKPTLKEVWVDPAGNDSNSGANRGQAFRSLTAAWNSIPIGTNLSGSGIKIMLGRGNYAEDMIPNYLESRYGTAQFPIILQSADGKGAAVLKGDLNIFDTRYLYIIDVNIIPDPAGDAFHCEQCDHILLRGMVLSGGNRAAHETIKINQSSYVYIENNDISGADDNSIDFVAVQNGHVKGNRIHNSEDWCMYAKGGSAYLTIEANEVFDCGTGGITAGQGTGFEFMTSPWLHYEAYDIKIVNNLIHDTQGAGLGVNGGYNILLAYNTLYRVGQRSHMLEVVFGERSCDGDATKCSDNLKVGGWGTAAPGDAPQPIPSRNIYVYNNLLFNPTGYQTGSQHLAIYGSRPTTAVSNISSPATTDVNLQIKGNLIWNGPADYPIGIEEDDQGCRPANPTCNLAQLQKDNSINKLQPQLANPAGGDFKLANNSNVAGVVAFAIPKFPGGDLPTKPQAPQGELNNNVSRDYAGASRSQVAPIGAYVNGSVGSTDGFQPADNPDPAFSGVWSRTDQPVSVGRASRSWMWGDKAAGFALGYEPYDGQKRLVQYHDKSRMEINNANGDRASLFFVTNGLLVREMIAGQIQLGDNVFETKAAAKLPVSGDPASLNPNAPTYASFQKVASLNNDRRETNRSGQNVTSALNKDGTISSVSAPNSVKLVYYNDNLGHNIPDVFWNFMNNKGLILATSGTYQEDTIINWVYAMGYPLSEPYWTRSVVGGTEKDVLVQVFERRVLSYTPSNSAAFQVEMGNVGQHYYSWRYQA